MKFRINIFLLLCLTVVNIFSENSSNQIKICLCMIVKNESRIIERCMDSAKSIVDCISICDTGSTDNTVELIQNYFKKNNLPGKVHKHEWKNFGHNRTLSAQAARETLSDLGFDLDHTYLLFLDADMVLKIRPEFVKNSLRAHAYSLVQKNGSMSYDNLRLGRADLDWRCVGVTHEYWAADNNNGSSKLTTLYIDDVNDGGCKSDKFERDIRLLLKGIEDEPDNVRYMFYLAQSYKCINNLDEAIKWYKKRIEKGGWYEEVWYSKYMLGSCYSLKNDWDNALHWYLNAYQHNPRRAEPLGEIARHYRLNAENNLAVLFAGHGKKIAYPKDQCLFISDPVYNYELDEDLSIAGYYTPFRQEAFEAANRLMLNRAAPYHMKENCHQNLYFYIKNLERTEFKQINIELPKITENDSYKPLNPSIVKTDSGYVLILRSVNYLQNAQKYKILDGSGIVNTRNFLVNCDKNFNFLDKHEIIEKARRIRFPVIVDGLEDCRLCYFDKNYWFNCNIRDTNSQAIPKMILCKLSDTKRGNTIETNKTVVLQGPDENRCEKNWLPFVFDNQLLMIYSYDPFVIYKPDLETGECALFKKVEPQCDFSRFRGGASPIEFDDGYLMLIHEVIFRDKRYYAHRFLFLNKDLEITKVSKPFTFKHKGVEFCCSMAIDHERKKLVMPIGIEDGEAWLCFADLAHVRSLLETIS